MKDTKGMQHIDVKRFKELHPILEGKPKRRIAYSDRPLALGGEITYLTPEEFEQKFHCKYANGLYSSFYDQGEIQEMTALKPHHLTLDSLPEHLIPSEKQVEERLFNPLDSLVICQIDSEVDYGLFTTKQIQAGTVIGIYGGVVAPSMFRCSPYGVNYLHDNLVLDGEGVRNEMPFMNHLPLNIDLARKKFLEEPSSGLFSLFFSSSNLPESLREKMDDILLEEFEEEMERRGVVDELKDVPENEKANIAYSKVAIVPVRYKGIELAVAVAEEHIYAQEQLGWNYGPKHSKQFQYKKLHFHKSGCVWQSASKQKTIERELVKKYPSPLTSESTHTSKKNQNSVTPSFHASRFFNAKNSTLEESRFKDNYVSNMPPRIYPK